MLTKLFVLQKNKEYVSIAKGGFMGECPPHIVVLRPGVSVTKPSLPSSGGC